MFCFASRERQPAEFYRRKMCSIIVCVLYYGLLIIYTHSIDGYGSPVICIAPPTTSPLWKGVFESDDLYYRRSIDIFYVTNSYSCKRFLFAWIETIMLDINVFSLEMVKACSYYPSARMNVPVCPHSRTAWCNNEILTLCLCLTTHTTLCCA